jgi:hypothetical protein
LDRLVAESLEHQRLKDTATIAPPEATPTPAAPAENLKECPICHEMAEWPKHREETGHGLMGYKGEPTKKGRKK